MALLIDGMYRAGNLPKPKPTPPKPASTASTPVDGSDRKLYARAAEQTGDKTILTDFDAALSAQRDPTPPEPRSTPSSTPPSASVSGASKPHVKPERAQDPSDQKFYNMAADRQNAIIDLENHAESLRVSIDVLGTAGGYATTAMRAELIETQHEIDALSRTRVSGDGDPGGTFSSEARRRFDAHGENAADEGRAVIERALEDTADGDQIQRDEFEVVELDNGKYLVVLPGVIDLTSPHLGWDPHSRSVRDTDQAAFFSSTSASIEDNRYARMVRDYMTENLPRGADVMIVGHSFGADTALDLASDPTFNNRRTGFNITHVTAAAYYSQPQLRHVQNGTEVLVLQNTRDLPVLVEANGYATSRDLRFAHDTGRALSAIERSAGEAARVVVGDVAGEVVDYLGDSAGAVPAVVDETIDAGQEFGEGWVESNRGAVDVVGEGFGWLGRSAWNSLETAGSATSSLVRGDWDGAGDALAEGRADQASIDAEAGDGLSEAAGDVVSGLRQQTSAVGGWVGDQVERIHERTVAAPSAHARDIVDSTLQHGGDVVDSLREHGGAIVEDIGDRDIYDLGPRIGTPGISPFTPTHGEDQVVVRFHGGGGDAGHHQRHYVDYINGTGDDAVRSYFESVSDAGYGGSGRSLAVDVSVPED